MKHLLTIVLLLSIINASASDRLSIEKCDNYQAYNDSGWVVHTPDSFQSVFENLNKKIELGLENGEIIRDLRGTTRTFNTYGGSPVLMAVETFDSLDTAYEIMYGDYAIMRNHFRKSEVLEVRWFDGVNKNVAINKKYMSCVSTNPPMAFNTIF